MDPTRSSLAVVLTLCLTLLSQSAGAATVPAGFTDELVLNAGAPTALAFTPDGRLLVTTQSGTIRVHQNGTLLPAPALSLGARVCSSSERGLLGIAVDPSFTTNRYIYVYYTYNGEDCVNRVSRLTLPDSNVISLASEMVLLDNIPSPAGNHNAGDVHFGKDGFLYVSVGDGGCDYAGDSGCAGSNDAARDRHTLLGKIVRITASGGIPASNPFQGDGTARCNSGAAAAGLICRETFAWGLRNPFRIAFDPNAPGTRFFINDVGQNAWEEIDLGISGADHGWNVREGHCANGSTTNCGPPPGGMTNPLYDYQHGSCGSITGGAFVPNGLWPSSYDNSYLYADFNCGRIFKLSNSGGSWNATTFATDLGASSAVTMIFGPDAGSQALYYTTYADGGEVRRIRYTSSTNRIPTAVLSATPTTGAAPLSVSFDGSGSFDPDAGNTLTYLWDFGDGTPILETSSATAGHTYTSGVYSARLRVRDNHGALSPEAAVTIRAGNTAPVISITSPAVTAKFAVGQTITLTAAANDAEDGALAASSLSWTLLLRHGSHTHPFLGPVTGNGITFAAPAPEDLAATTNSHLEIRVTATDSAGASTTVVQTMLPRLVTITFNSRPPGLQLTVNGRPLTAPATVTSWEAYALNVTAPAQIAADGRRYFFSSWSDGGAASHLIVTPAAAASYTARFSRRARAARRR